MRWCNMNTSSKKFIYNHIWNVFMEVGNSSMHFDTENRVPQLTFNNEERNLSWSFLRFEIQFHGK